MSLAKDQNCATNDMLKIPTQRKKATPTYGTRAATASANSSMQTMKNSVAPTSSRARSTREANQLYTHKNPMRSSAWPAAAYDRTSAPPHRGISGSRTVLITEFEMSSRKMLTSISIGISASLG